MSAADISGDARRLGWRSRFRAECAIQHRSASSNPEQLQPCRPQELNDRPDRAAEMRSLLKTSSAPYSLVFRSPGEKLMPDKRCSLIDRS
jgi:hypothetical protein